MAARHITQCEGCEEPLVSLMADYEAGRVTVTWTLCPVHTAEVEHIQGADAMAQLYPAYDTEW